MYTTKSTIPNYSNYVAILTVQSMASGSQDSITTALSDVGMTTSDRERRVTVSGEVCFHVTCNLSLRRLDVIVQQCRNLASATQNKLSNP